MQSEKPSPLNDVVCNIPQELLSKIGHSIPKTSLQFKQMIDETIHSMDIEPSKYIHIATYIALMMVQDLKQRDADNQTEYLEKRTKLVSKGKKWDKETQHELKKIDAKKKKHEELLQTLDAKRDILKTRLQQIHDKHVSFLEMERKKNSVLQQLEQDKIRLEKILVEKVEKDLERFETELKHKRDPIRDKTEYDKLQRKIKICTLKKQVIHAKLDSINKTVELTDLKSLDLNECHCVFCKGYSPHQYYFGIRKDVNGSNYRKMKEKMEREKLSKPTPDVTSDEDDDDDDDEDGDTATFTRTPSKYEETELEQKFLNEEDESDAATDDDDGHEQPDGGDVVIEDLGTPSPQKALKTLADRRNLSIIEEQSNSSMPVSMKLQSSKAKASKTKKSKAAVKTEKATKKKKAFTEHDLAHNALERLRAKREAVTADVTKSKKKDSVRQKQRRSSTSTVGDSVHDLVSISKKEIRKNKKRTVSLGTSGMPSIGAIKKEKPPARRVVNLEEMMKENRDDEKQIKATMKNKSKKKTATATPQTMQKRITRRTTKK